MTEKANALARIEGTGDSGDLVAIARQTREIKDLGKTLLDSGLLPDSIYISAARMQRQTINARHARARAMVRWPTQPGSATIFVSAGDHGARTASRNCK